MQTFFVIKPEIVEQNKDSEIIDILKKNNFSIQEKKKVHLTKEQAERLYGEHKGKFFYEKLIQYVIRSPIIMMILKGEGDVVKKLRELVGNTCPEKAAHGTIRHKYGTNVTVNAVHTSDSIETAKREIKFFHSV